MHQKSKLAIILLTISTPVLAAVYLAWNNKASKNVELTYDQAIKIEDQDRNVLSNSLAIKERKVLEKAQAALQESQNPIIKETSVNTGSTVFASLKEIGISATEASLIIEAAKPEQDLGSIKSGSRIISESSKDQSGIEEVKKVTFYLEKTSYLEIVKQKDSWQAKVFSLPLTVTNELVSGVVQSSLWDSAMSAGLDSQAIQNLTDIFGWLRSLLFNKELELSILGLQNAGKTTFVNVLANNTFDEDTIPTIGFNYKKLKKGKVEFKLWDLGKFK